MFKTFFNSQLKALHVEDDLTEKFWQEIKTQYSRGNRHYHNLAHLDNLVNELAATKETISDWETVIFSIAYHDIVYNIHRQDNEEKSAELAVERLKTLDISTEQKEKCRQQILATKAHGGNTDNDTNLFTDADLSILGADINRYEEYAQQIRKEYKIYPDFLYKQGRKKVLLHFLGMSSIYKTVYFSNKYEQQARENIEMELKKLG